MVSSGRVGLDSSQELSASSEFLTWVLGPRDFAKSSTALGDVSRIRSAIARTQTITHEGC